MTHLLKLSNLILLNIITEIDNNGDIVCLLLTCKQLYQNSSLRKSIQFKGIRVINDNGELSQQFVDTATRFNLFSFNDILKNSVSDQQIILPDKEKYNYDHQWIQDRISTVNRADKSNIKTALVMYSPKLKDLQKSLYDIPSIETLFIDDDEPKLIKAMDLGSISLLPNLQRLVVDSYKLNLGPHTTLKSLELHIDTKYPLVDLGLIKLVSLTKLIFNNHFVTDIGPGLLPSSLTSLILRPKEIPPRNTFLSLTSLVNLEIYLESRVKYEGVQDHPFIDLSSLSNLNTLLFEYRNDPIETIGHRIEMSVPTSIKILKLYSNSIQIPSKCSMPKLDKLYVHGSVLISGSVSLLTSPSLKKLVMDNCQEMIPPNIIPSTVERLIINNYTAGLNIVKHVVFPPFLTHLAVTGNYETIKHPPSLVKLRYMLTEEQSLPQHLKQVSWEVSDAVEFLPTSFPPNLERLGIFDFQGYFQMDIPSTIKYLTIFLTPDPESKKQPWLNNPLYSINTSLTDMAISQPQWLPHNTTHLTCHVGGGGGDDVDPREYGTHQVFRLDEVINHTNVRYLSLRTTEITLQFTIQRLDNNNRNVLVLETQTLTGGIISNNRQQYDPIYLHLNIDDSNPFDYKWCFDM
ncbi:hypothetical protein DFA_08339 [Cavenderia fasciculata]|uniref:Uncharacterized protein n=1 Tax=Cavenderia fasciculata TaxID=261658 RepID=F4Q5T5_CACFS|nr:uncharacterized protein DFA_08339 [Cavenderia fasciculata]EGG17344.1 hypothetical protein DFA_08339 [Cavenderia fasciculata]|eukprot:XP_004355828.1 hypothetical protein DFA_08339 [Cavenderia fasciculata]